MNETLTPQIEVQPIEQAPLPAAKPPKFIKVMITEDDRQNAEGYCDSSYCLIATAFKRCGYFPAVCDAATITIGKHEYSFDCRCGQAESLDRTGSKHKPFYAPSVIGRVISCTLIENE